MVVGAFKKLRLLFYTALIAFMGCRTPIRQMPSGILLLTPDFEPGEKEDVKPNKKVP
jgi:hypothetical protein